MFSVFSSLIAFQVSLSLETLACFGWG